MPVAAAPVYYYFLSFSDFYVFKITACRSNLYYAEVAHSVICITYVIDMANRVAADPKTLRSPRSHSVVGIVYCIEYCLNCLFVCIDGCDR